MHINNNRQNMEGIKGIIKSSPFHPSYAIPQLLEKVINGYQQI